ncbi:hypothetical protein CCUS01_16360 [Colletotrichum cuscutae]|uniref:Uncharacterized protein n=1 Tax=Colletotrichum cuscutae TaxID=1209917 RepID=A0AAI9V9R0_9PEZI|nr:hypothetical protein CCUS01_16360 [Colletotrichum cuscutae]
MECKEQPRSLADESQLAVEEASIKESRDVLFSLRLLPTPPESVTQNDFWRRPSLAGQAKPGDAASTTNATQTNELQACTRSAAAGWPPLSTLPQDYCDLSMQAKHGAPREASNAVLGSIFTTQPLPATGQAHGKQKHG